MDAEEQNQIQTQTRRARKTNQHDGDTTGGDIGNIETRGRTIENSFIIDKSTAPNTWLELLERGLKFISTPTAWNHHIWTSEVDAIINKITNHI